MTLGLASIAVTMLEVRINLPDWLIQVAMVKLAVLGSLGLLGASAVLGRHAARQKRLDAAAMAAIGEGASEAPPRHKERDRVRQESERREDDDAK